MNAYTIQTLIFICFIIVAMILSTSLIKDAALESRERKEEKARLRRRKAAISGESALTRTERAKQKIMYNLDVIRMPKQTFLVLEIGAAILGFFLGRIILTRMELALCMTVVFIAVPVLFIAIRASWYKQHEAAMLKNCMVMITGAYRTSKDIIKAIKDNINKPNMPEAFKKFISEVTYVDSNVERALRKVGASFSNRYFSEWIEILIKAQYDSTMMDVLPVIIDEMDEAQKAQNESAAAMKAVWREYAMWVIAMICVPLVLKLNAQWYNALVNTIPGKVLVVAMFIGLLNSMRVMAKISKPIDY